ncbi:fructose-bisphosphate aldolase [Colletotrichum asianum]
MAVPTNWKDNNRHLQILRNAEKGRYGVIAAIAYNLEQIYGLVAAAEQAQSPLILQFFPWAVNYADGLLVRTAKESIRRASVPISIHLDHAQDEKIIKYAADNLPFDSIMYCHERGIATEAEPGRIEGAEDGIGGRVRVALHGTNGFPSDLMRQCIAAGATKINVNKLVLDEYYMHLRHQVARVPHTTLIEEGTYHVKRQTMEWMEICGSAGKA